MKNLLVGVIVAAFVILAWVEWDAGSLKLAIGCALLAAVNGVLFV